MALSSLFACGSFTRLLLIDSNSITQFGKQVIRQSFACPHGGIKTFECRSLGNGKEGGPSWQTPIREKAVLKWADEKATSYS
jgi:hypothetical protein